MANNEYIVEMRGITKRFPGIVANDNVDIKIKKGEIFAILGENGAGKSTLMSMLFGMYEPDEGDIYIRGKKEKIDSPRKADSLSIGMVHQHFKLVENFTITENIILGIEPKTNKFLIPTVDIKGSDEKIRELSKHYGLDVNPEDVIEDIQVSVQQRVEILKMLYREAEILILDEPTAVLTPQEIEFLLKIIKNLQADGKTIILITHKLDEVKKIADRCAILYRGKLTHILDVKETEVQEMANLMVGKEIKFSDYPKNSNFNTPVLEVKKLTIENTDGFEVVKNVTFTIHENEIFSIAGVSGNGQIEIANAIAGLQKVKSGNIFLYGKDITNMSVRERTEKGISYIPEDRQIYGLILDFTLANNTVLKTYYKEPFSNKLGTLDNDEISKYANELIEKFDIRSGQGKNTIVRSMSGGNQQKVIIAREISLDANLVLFVQPTRGLDIGAINNIQGKIIEERDEGKAVLLISLELDEIMACADTIGVIYNGEIKKISPAKELTRTQIGEYMMGVGKIE